MWPLFQSILFKVDRSVDSALFMYLFYSTCAVIGSTLYLVRSGDSLSIELRYETKILLLWAIDSFDGQLLYVLYVGNLLSLNLSIFGVWNGEVEVSLKNVLFIKSI